MDNLNTEIKEGLFEITFDDILSLFTKSTVKLKSRDIKNHFKARYPDGNLFSDKVDIDKVIDSLLKEDQRKGQESELKYSKGSYSKRSKIRKPIDVPLQYTEYIGRAGECAVMSELLFRAYNVNRMMVDEGVDLVAVKDNIYYYIQVKTTGISQGRIQVQIKNGNFDKFLGKQLRYLIVARILDAKGEPKNLFFKFTQEDIDKGIFSRYIKRGENAVIIKIKFSEKTGAPILYDDTESDISWHMNNFEL